MTFISIPRLVEAAVSLLLIYRVGVVIYRLYFHPLSKYPGPKYFAVSALPQLYYQNLLGTFFKDIRDLHNQYGNIVRVAPNDLSVDGSIGWNDVFAHKKAGQPDFGKDKLFYKPAELGGIDGNGFDSILSTSKENHRRMRRILAHAFSDSAPGEQGDIVQSYVELLIQRLSERADSDDSLDMVEYVNWTTFDTIGDLTFGESFHCLETCTTHLWIRIIFPLVKMLSHLQIFIYYPSLKLVLRIFTTEASIQVFKKSLAYTGDRLEKRIALGENTTRKDFLSYILRYNDENGMTPQEIMSTSEILTFAGSETTTSLLSSLVYYLASHPSAWRKLTAEVREAFSVEKEITMRATAGLPYLHACLEEGLRVYPPIGLTPPRISSGGIINGDNVPEGTRIWIPQWSTHHRESNFHQADDFIPERWLPSSHPLYDPKFAKDNRACMQPFSAGSRGCIGKKLAYAEMRLVFARIAWNFELELMPESRTWLKQHRCFMSWEKPRLMMKVHRRMA